jgi:hypothetical protein
VGICFYLQVFLVFLVAVLCVVAALPNPGRSGGNHHLGFGHGNYGGYRGHGGYGGYGHGHGGSHHKFHGLGHHGHH